MEVNHFTPIEMTLSYSINVRLGGPQSRSGPFGEEKYFGRFGNRNQDGLARSLVTVLITLNLLLLIG